MYKVRVLILRDSLFNLNQEDILMSWVLMIDTSELIFAYLKNKLISSANMIDLVSSNVFTMSLIYIKRSNSPRIDPLRITL